MSAITGVEFHTDRISSLEGGLSPIPHPKLRKANGVDYWFISGELSGYFTDEFGVHIAVGPIDLKGVSHRGETFDTCPPDVTCVPSAHPRAGLPGAFFALSFPVRGFNGGMCRSKRLATEALFGPHPLSCSTLSTRWPSWRGVTPSSPSAKGGPSLKGFLRVVASPSSIQIPTAEAGSFGPLPECRSG